MLCKMFGKEAEKSSVIDTLEPRENKHGDAILEEPENIFAAVKPIFPKASRKHIYPLNTRYEDDPDKGGYIKPKGIIWHYTVTYHTQATVDYFKRNVVDVQFVVGHLGECIQMVPCNRRAAHAGKSSWKGLSSLNGHFIGIEFVNIGPLFPYKGKYLDWYNRDRMRKGNKYNFWKGPVLDNYYQGHRYWEPLTEAQLKVGKEISFWCMQQYGFGIDNVIAHHECSPGRKMDIGGIVEGGIERVRRELLDWQKS